MYLRDGSAQTIVRAATLRYKLLIQLSTSPSHSILTPGRPVAALTLYRQAPGRVATGVPIFKCESTLKHPVASGIRTPGSSAPEADALTARPARRSGQTDSYGPEQLRTTGSADNCGLHGGLPEAVWPD